MKVLIVDGSALVRSRLAERFADEGFAVIGVGDARTAMSLLAGGMDAVVLDVSGAKDELGIQVLVRLRLAAPDVIIIVLTNATDELVRRECLRRGADFFFDKSHDVERAVETMVRLSTMTRPS